MLQKDKQIKALHETATPHARSPIQHTQHFPCMSPHTHTQTRTILGLDVQILSPTLVYTSKHTYKHAALKAEPAAHAGSVLASPCKTYSPARQAPVQATSARSVLLPRSDSSRQSQRESCSLAPLCRFSYPCNSSQMCTCTQARSHTLCPPRHSLLTIQPLNPVNPKPRTIAHCRCCCCHHPWHIYYAG
jgi:hypothetical protein